MKSLYVKVVNSKLWYHMYYKHTKQHKQELASVRQRVLKRRDEILGMRGGDV